MTPGTDPALADRTDEALFAELVETGSRRIRNELVNRHLGLAYAIAGQFRNRGVSREDLNQVAMLALVKSVSRFDPTHGAPLSSYAGRTIEGELKRHFRDSTWQVRTPRSLKQLSVKVRKASAALEQELGRSPSPREVASILDCSVDDVVEALTAANAYRADSLDAPPPGGDAAQDRDPGVGETDGGFGDVDARLVTERLLQALDERERHVVRLRFFEDRSQQSIADELGISQMTISRMLRRSFERMREAAANPSSTPAEVPATTLRVPPRRDAIGVLRRRFTEWLSEQGVTGADAEVLQLLASELVTNAVEQDPREDIVMEAVLDSERTAVSLHVRNSRQRESTLPDRQTWGPADELATRGRGLLILDSVCSHVTWRDTPTSTTVTARYTMGSAA